MKNLALLLLLFPLLSKSQQAGDEVTAPAQAQATLNGWSEELQRHYQAGQFLWLEADDGRALLKFPNQFKITYGKILVISDPTIANDHFTELTQQLNSLGWHVYLLIQDPNASVASENWLNAINRSVDTIEAEGSDELFLFLMPLSSSRWIHWHADGEQRDKLLTDENIAEELKITEQQRQLLANLTPKISTTVFYLPYLPQHHQATLQSLTSITTNTPWLIISNEKVMQQAAPTLAMIVKQQNIDLIRRDDLTLGSQLSDQLTLIMHLHGYLKTLTLQLAK
ncbi:MAG: hypothetical protein HWE11_05405 [Gammaproteobacteria bacterium]|nr:hypothetical protein [Gammaproteobacteria bacterium]